LGWPPSVRGEGGTDGLDGDQASGIGVGLSGKKAPKSRDSSGDERGRGPKRL